MDRLSNAREFAQAIAEALGKLKAELDDALAAAVMQIDAPADLDVNYDRAIQELESLAGPHRVERLAMCLMNRLFKAGLMENLQSAWGRFEDRAGDAGGVIERDVREFIDEGILEELSAEDVRFRGYQPKDRSAKFPGGLVLRAEHIAGLFGALDKPHAR